MTESPAGLVDVGLLRYRLIEMAVAQGHPLDLCVEFAQGAVAFIVGDTDRRPSEPGRRPEDQELIDGLLLGLSKLSTLGGAAGDISAAQGETMPRHMPPSEREERERRNVQIMRDYLAAGRPQYEAAKAAGINTSAASNLCKKHNIKFPHAAGLKSRSTPASTPSAPVVTLDDHRPGDRDGKLPRVVKRRCASCPTLFETDLIDDIWCAACKKKRAARA